MAKMMEYPDNLINAIFGDVAEYNTAPDLLGSIEYCLYTLDVRERELINRRFKQGMTLEESGQIFNIGKERTRQVITRALRKLRHPSRSKLIKYGLKGFIEMKTRDMIDETAASNETINAKLDMTIGELDITRRAYFCLYRANLCTVRDILKVIQDGSLLKVRNLGMFTAKEIINAIHKIGLNTDVEEVTVDGV